jgi:predicted helicase
MTTIHTILEQFRQDADSNRELGDKFERLMATYFVTDPLYKEQYSEVWLWREWADRPEQVDTGIDLVAKERATGDYCAIQCKFYRPDHQLQKSDIDSFFTASGKKFLTSEGEKKFAHRLIVSTTDNWSKHAEAALKNQQIPVVKLGVADLARSPIEWSEFLRTQKLRLRPKKTLRPHQQEAVAKVLAGFQTGDRGKLIMACGTGKTFTALKLAEYSGAKPDRSSRPVRFEEEEVVKPDRSSRPVRFEEEEVVKPDRSSRPVRFEEEEVVKPDRSSRPVRFGDSDDFNLVLFLVPSISLLSQSLREWTAEAERPLQCVAVCSDSKASQTEAEDLSVRDLAFPATTEVSALVQQIEKIQRLSRTGNPMTVVFSTYQSIEVIAQAQQQGVPAFDVVICDEAHRTTGVTLVGAEDSHFVKVHSQEVIKAKKRLYMTATPRIFTDVAKTKAQESEAVLCSMDDEKLYGPEFYRLGFSEAVSRELLSDYKVMVLGVDERYISKAFQAQLADKNNEITLDDAAKIVGCWNGLAKRTPDDLGSDVAPMRRAVAFSGRIKDSERMTGLFAKIIAEYGQQHPEEELLQCEVKHVDGKMNVLKRNDLLDWLRSEPVGNTCHILSNARCLSEGVDVPALDAVMFLNPRNSIVDVVQSVGRVMRKAEGKRYGYVILPIVISSHLPPEEALKDDKKYKVVWQVLQALRAHDDRFNATVNKIELNKQRPDNIQFIGIGGPTGGVGENGAGYHLESEKKKSVLLQLPFLEEWREAIYAKIVLKCGDRRYWENWAQDVARIAEQHITRIQGLLADSKSGPRQVFEEFLKSLQNNLNPSVTEADAIEMLSQHLITRPVFDALFEGYQFTQQNPVSQAMQKMLAVLEGAALEKETALLEKFYDSVKSRASGIDNAEAKQKIVIELYDKFFKMAFPRMAERLGIVYTPVEVVDFIIRSAEEALRQEFGVGLTDSGVHILDPFTGTGTFMVRLLQSGLIQTADLPRKFASELHANEIVLLAYYIAAINIEATYHELVGGEYSPFQGIVLTDTFQMEEKRKQDDWVAEQMLPENNQRVVSQKQREIRVIIGNPPYSAGQTSENDNNKNLKYESLDDRIRSTYAEHSTATNKNSLYDSYIRAIRWASDRIKEKGIVCYVTNGSFIDGNAMEGLRKCLTDDFSAIYCFNLRGNQRTSGETSRREGGKIFGSGSRAAIAITLLIKNPQKTRPCELFYHDIGDYLSREEKLTLIANFSSLKSIQWDKLTPNDQHDWINQRNEDFASFMAMGDKKDDTEKTIFEVYSGGVQTNRDTWVYNFSKGELNSNVRRMIVFYNSQVDNYHQLPRDKRPDVEKFIDNDTRKFSWTRESRQDLERNKKGSFDAHLIVRSMYRPYCKQWLYFHRQFNKCVYQMPKIFPNENLGNVVICVTGIGVTKDFNTFITNCLPDVQLQANGQCFPLYSYEKAESQGKGLFATPAGEYSKKENIPDAILTEFRKTYTTTKQSYALDSWKVSKEDIFYYVYGLLHSPSYKTRFAADLKKMLPRIPLVKDFWAFSKAGRELAQWHLHYETIEPYPLPEDCNAPQLDPKTRYRVQKMQFAKTGKTVDKTTLIYNSHVTLSGIPLETYEYIVNGKAALDWIIERYQVTTDKDSGIHNDPNDWSEEPRYILDLVKRVVRVSVETVRIVKGLPGQI